MAERSEFEFFAKLSIGQYIPTGSVVHRLDPRVKLILGVFLVVAAVTISSLVSALILTGAVILGLHLARVQLRLAFAPLKVMLIFLFILALIQLLTIPQFRTDADVIFQRGVLKITDRSIVSAILLIVRFVVIVLGLSLFSFSTSSSEVIHGIEHFLRPLQKIGFPAHELALTAHISLHFLPILVGEAEQLMMAQAARGADFGYRKWNFLRKIRKMLPLLVPLFIVSLKHAQNMTRAMESRCYTGGAGRTHFVRLQLQLADYLGLFLGCTIIASVMVVNLLKVDGVLWGLVKKLAV
jgi:energy-coupling factor transport system permease protein